MMKKTKGMARGGKATKGMAMGGKATKGYAKGGKTTKGASKGGAKMGLAEVRSAAKNMGYKLVKA